MTIRQFASLVAEMRNAQREFYRTRSATSLEIAKRLERRVDETLRDLISPQPTLFDEDEDDR